MGFILNPHYIINQFLDLIITFKKLGENGAIVGDINGDGIADYVIGSPGTNISTYNSAGKVYIIFGVSHSGNKEAEI